jgi:transcriptional pleiotropic regulator of transition state genes
MESRSRNRGPRTTTGIVRHLDELGRIVVPVEIRRRFGLVEHDPLEISVEGQAILLRRPGSTCVFCGATRSILEHRGQGVCRSCRRELASAAR